MTTGGTCKRKGPTNRGFVEIESTGPPNETTHHQSYHLAPCGRSKLHLIVCENPEQSQQINAFDKASLDTQKSVL